MKYLYTLAIIISSLSLCYPQKTGYSSNFQTPQQIRDYLRNNISLLDPLEGEYDQETSGDYITPYVHQKIPSVYDKMFIVCNNNVFSSYCLTSRGDFFRDNCFSFYSIGETNAYRMSLYNSTTTRIYLQNRNRFNTTVQLNNESAKLFTGNNKLATFVNIILKIDCIKVYPTASMYEEVIRKRIEEDSKPSTWTGTGFALKDNYIVTNYHVIENAKSIYVKGVNGNFNNKYRATVIASDKYNDLAILRVNGISITSISIPYSVKTTTAEVGEDVFVLGYPLTSTMGDEIKLTTGVVSSKSGYQGDLSLYQISAPVQPGNSGGPLFDSKGSIIGIVSAKHQGAENVGYAIKASYLSNLVESAISASILPKSNRVLSQNLTGKVKSVKDYVYLIVCSRE